MCGRQARLRVWLVVLLAPAMLQAQGPGNRLYSEHCALCHGARDQTLISEAECLLLDYVKSTPLRRRG
jgi:hypothetical protein